ncbi:MAG TPA: class I SAM-dependent methyltransferase [Candidatus Baltobacteraceae bacterium]|nr:class I SAM-dependent methyltransferase [Candidatus Baltobacteraceae bacterium]
MERIPAGRGVLVDVPCGFGRHTLLALDGGFSVIAIDISAERIAHLEGAVRARRDAAQCRTIVGDVDAFDFGKLGPFDVAVVTDFVSTPLLLALTENLRPQGHLIHATFGARGGNAIDLPKRGEVAAALEASCDLLIYEERPAQLQDSAVVRCLARRY